MGSKTSPLSDFYTEEKFNPTFIDVDNKQKLRTHYAKRLNLYTNKLKLSPALFKDALCLEFGCSSGENSLMMASLGAKFEFVEPQIDAIKRLEGLFEENGYADNIVKIHNDIIENHTNDTHKFDFVIAEGFLHYVPSKNEQLKKILGYLKPTGQCLISTADPYGQFIQLFKVFVFKYLQNAEGLNDDASKMNLARALFEKEYASIPHSRPFEMYIKDTFYNPYIGRKKYWGVEDLIPAVREAGFIVRTSWPYYGYSDDLLWHKHVQTDDALIEECLKRYYMKVPSYIASEELNQHSAEWAKKFARSVKTFMDALEDYYDQTFAGDFDVAVVDQIIALLNEYYQDSVTVGLFDEVKQLLNVLFEGDKNGFVNAYNKSVLTKLWGVSYHYMCFSRNYASENFINHINFK